MEVDPAAGPKVQKTPLSARFLRSERKHAVGRKGKLLKRHLKPGPDRVIRDDLAGGEPAELVNALSGQTGHSLDDILRLPEALQRCRIHEDDVWQYSNFLPDDDDCSRLRDFMALTRNTCHDIPESFDPTKDLSDVFHLMSRICSYDYGHELWLMNEYNRKARGELYLRGRLLNLCLQLAGGRLATPLVERFTLPRRMRDLTLPIPLPADRPEQPPTSAYSWKDIVGYVSEMALAARPGLEFRARQEDTRPRMNVGGVLDSRAHERYGATVGSPLAFPDVDGNASNVLYRPTQEERDAEAARYNTPLRACVPAHAHSSVAGVMAGPEDVAFAGSVKEEPGLYEFIDIADEDEEDAAESTDSSIEVVGVLTSTGRVAKIPPRFDASDRREKRKKREAAEDCDVAQGYRRGSRRATTVLLTLTHRLVSIIRLLMRKARSAWGARLTKILIAGQARRAAQ